MSSTDTSPPGPLSSIAATMEVQPTLTSIVMSAREKTRLRGEDIRDKVRGWHNGLRVVSLFSGCGGLDLGFQGDFLYLGTRLPTLGYKIIWANDNSKGAIVTYEQNIGKHIHFGNIETYDKSTIPPAEMIIGGFPCQDFSASGSRTGIRGVKGRLYLHMIDVIAGLEPLCFVAENVANLKTINRGADYQHILHSFEHIGKGYDVACWDLKAVDYGIAQTRKRLFFVGFRKDLYIGTDRITPPPSLFLDRPLSACELIDDLRFNGESVPNQLQVSRAGLLHPMIKSQGDEMIRANQPAPTMRATHHGRIQFHYEEPRRLTVREVARFQTFPESFVFTQTMTDNYRQVGNAVPPVLAWHVAARVREIIDEIVFLLPPARNKTVSAF